MKKFIITGSIFGFLAVALGAFAAHGLKDVLDDYGTGIWNTAVQYQMFHAVGIIIVAILMSQRLFGNIKLLNIAGWAMIIGTLIFSGSLYALALSGVKMLGAITPFGGVSFLVGWFCLMMVGVKHAR